VNFDEVTNMYTFSEESRIVLESSAASFVYYQNINDRAMPVLASDGFCRNTGMPKAQVLEWLGRNMFERMHPDDVGIVSKVSDEFLHHRGPYDVIFRCRLSAVDSKEYIIIHGIGNWQTMPDGTELAVISYANLTASMKTFQDNVQSYGLLQKDRFYTDFLTSLPNINYMHEFGREKVDQICSSGHTPMLIYSDVDSMQSYNNQYGLEEGDNLLCLIAATLKELFPKALVTRGADDHFVTLTDVDDKKELERLLDKANDKVKRGAKGNTAGIFSGICPVDADGTGNAIGRAVDHARHALKRIDTNLNQKVRFFSEELDEHYWRSRYIVENIDRAIENDWIKVYYHGLFRVETGKVSAFEALARWVDPVRGIISPAEFIPALQKYHLLYKLDLYMFEQVCREVTLRHENGLPLMPVSVNFSRQDFDHTDIVGRMNEIYEESGVGKLVDKNFFIIEITEQDVASDPQSCQLQVRKIKDSGYRLWLDDFGSGYSSFDMFSKFKFDLIKYDMELIRHLDDNDGANRLVLKELVHLAKELKLHTLIEGVETEEQLAFVREIGCELVQGYYYHKPEPLEEILFRLHAGGTIKTCETQEERDRLNRKWFE
jgi:diguanylate cyclase (GGDEF)-like protein